MYTSVVILLIVAAVFFVLAMIFLKKAFHEDNTQEETVGFSFMCLIILILGVAIPVGLAVHRTDVIENVPFPVKEADKK